jgi:tRNA threonylcarbamoyladenosine biosynthesis protein TsaE
MKEFESFFFQNEQQLLNFGQSFAKILRNFLSENADNALTIYLNGDLGAGKTTLTRSIVQSLGYNGNVKSPTYTLVEEYHLLDFSVYHFDLYRLSDPEELEFMGIRDYFRPQTLCLLEWAEKGQGVIPNADLCIQLDYLGEGRKLTLLPQNAAGARICANFSENYTA